MQKELAGNNKVLERYWVGLLFIHGWAEILTICAFDQSKCLAEIPSEGKLMFPENGFIIFKVKKPTSFRHDAFFKEDKILNEKLSYPPDYNSF